MDILTFLAPIAGQKVSLPPKSALKYGTFESFFILLTLNPQNISQSGQNVIFFAHHQATEVTVPGGKKFYYFDT